MSTLALDSILVQIARSENIKSSRYDVERSENHGYLANVNTITLQDEETRRVLHLFLKKAPENVPEEFRVLYKNEADFYKIIMTAFEEILPVHGRITTPLVPKTYFVNQEVIVMDDMSKSDFKVWQPLNQPLNVEHIDAVLVAYGKFHAFSYALKRKRPELFKSHGIKWEWFLTSHQSLVDEGYYASVIEKVAAAFDANNERNYIEAIKHYFYEGQVNYLEALLANDETDVYVHGDCWTHNFMFRYDPGQYAERPKEVCILDFQLVRKTSPVTDISYFFATSGCSHEVFDNIERYLRVYYESLQENLKLLECPNVFTWETFLQEWHRFSLRGLLMGAIVNKMMVADEDELQARKDIPLPQQFDFISRHEKSYQQRMRILVKYFYDNEIITQW